MLLGACSPSNDSNSSAWSNLDESSAGFSTWNLIELEKGGPYAIDYKGVSLAVALEEMQNQGIITAKWIIGKEHLLNKFYDIDLREGNWKTKHDIALTFYSWINEHFAVQIGEQEVPMVISYLIPPETSLLIKKSNEVRSSISTKKIDGEFGVLLTGITWDEYCCWLRKHAKQPIISKERSDVRYDFFLQCFPPDEKTVIEGLSQLGFRLDKTEAMVNAVVIKKCEEH